MSSFLYSVLIGCIIVCNANAADIHLEEVSSKESKSLRIVRKPFNHIGSGAVVEMAGEKEKKNVILSCHHILGDYLYDHFNEPEYFMLLDKSKTTKKGLCTKDFHKYSFDYMRLTSPLYSNESFIVNRTESRKDLFLKSNYGDSSNIYCDTSYISFCEDGIALPIELSCLLLKDKMIGNVEKYTLPSREIIDSWKNGVHEITAYGHSKTQYSEYKMTCRMQLSSDGKWFKNASKIPSIDDFFMKCAGMSGGPCFIDGNLCGVISGVNGQGYLHIKAITNNIVDGLNKIVDKI